MRTLWAVVQLAFPRRVPAREKVRFRGEVTADHHRIAGTSDPRVGDVRQVGTAERYNNQRETRSVYQRH